MSVHCTYIVHTKYLHVITAVFNFCIYSYNYNVDPSIIHKQTLNLTIPPKLYTV